MRDLPERQSYPLTIATKGFLLSGNHRCSKSENLWLRVYECVQASKQSHLPHAIR